MRTIGGVCLIVGLAVGFSGWGWAEEQPPESPQVMLDGHCPVTLIEQHRWEKGDAQYGAVHEGRTYLFVGRGEQHRFIEAPRKYAPPLPAEIAKPSAPMVGDLGKPANLEIRGATTFTGAEIAKVLGEDIDLASAARPGMPLGMFLKVLADQTRLGYQSDGFPEVKVEAFVDHPRHKVVLTINEGPRFMAGEIRVTGTRTIDPAWLIEQLTPVADAVPQGGAVVTWSPVKKNNGMRWPIGKPAWFDATSLGRLRERVETLLADLGRKAADFTLDVMPEPTHGVAPLVIRFQHEGRPATIDEIEIIGNKRNSRDDVLAFLDVRPGMLFTREVRERIDERLIHSGRFTKSNVKNFRPTKPGEPFKLRISLTEYVHAPLLTKPLSREEAALVRFSQWVRHFDEGEDDLLVQFSDAERTWELVVSPRHGVLALVRSGVIGNSPNAENLSFESAFVVGEQKFGAYSSARRQKFSAVAMPAPLVVLLTVTIHGGPLKFDGKCSMTTGIQVHSDFKRDRRHIKPQLRLTAVAALALAHLDDSRCTWGGGTLRVDYAGRYLRIDERTGRLIDQVVYEPDGPRTRTMVAQGEFERRSREIDAATVGFTEVADVLGPWTKACEFFCDEVLIWLPTTDRSQARRLVTVCRTLVDRGLFAPLDRLLVEAFGSGQHQAEFSIPTRERFDDVTKDMAFIVRVFAKFFGIRLGNALWPEESWTCDWWREATLAAAGTRDSAHELARQFWSPEIGPLHCLLNGELAQELGVPQLATIYAHARAFTPDDGRLPARLCSIGLTQGIRRPMCVIGR